MSSPPPSAGNPVRLVSPFHRIVNVGWGSGPFALIEMDGVGASLDVLDAKTPTPPHFTFPVAGQPSDTIDPNTYKKSATPVLAGFEPAPEGDLIHGDQGVWFGYGSVPGTYEFDDATIVIPGPTPTAPTPNDGIREFTPPTHDPIPGLEFLDADFAPKTNIPSDRSKEKHYYLVDLGVVNQLKITNGSISAATFTYDSVIETPDRNPAVIVEVPGWILVELGPPGTTGRWAAFVGATVSRYQPVEFGFPSTAEIIETTTIDVPAFGNVTKVSVYAGGIFVKDGQIVSWEEFPPNPNPGSPAPYTAGGQLLWSTTVAGSTPVTIDKTGVVA